MDRKPEFFISHRPGPKTTPRKDIVRMEAITLHKQNYSIYDIQALLKAKGHIISHTAISEILREEGFARLPKRSKVEVRQVRNYHGAFSDYYSPKPGKFCTAGNIDRKGKMDPFDRW